MSDLHDLIAQVESAVGPDRELDARLWLALTPGATRRIWSYTHTASGCLCEVDETREANGRLITVPELTASETAVYALIENIQPGTESSLRWINPANSGHWYAAATIWPSPDKRDALAKTRPLALILALLRTQVSTEEKA